MGKGRLVLLNCAAPYASELAGLWADLPAIARVEPLADDTAGDLELVLFEHGPARYLGVLHGYMNSDQNARTRLRLTSAWHVYDVRAGNSLGLRDAIDVDLAPGGCALYSLLPYRIDALRAAAEPGEPTLSRRIECRVLAGGGVEAGAHVFRIDVVDPDGTAVEHYGQNLAGQHGAAATSIPFAESDKPGTWTVRVRDVATGTTSSVAIERR